MPARWGGVLWLALCGVFGLAVTVPANLAVIGYQTPASHNWANSVVQSTDLVADLRAFVGATVPSSDGGNTGTVVRVFGQSTVGDSGGGVFYWNATSTAADDGVDTIKPTSVGGVGRWLRMPPSAGLSGASINLYVDTGGSDGGGANSCQTPATPCQSPQAAINWAYRLDTGGATVFIHLAAGESWTGNWIFNGPLRGGSNATLFSASYYWGQPQIILSGGGSGSTSLIGGSAGCYTVLSDAGAWVGLEKLAISGTGSGCQSALYLQLKGNASIYGDVKFTAASTDLIHMETGSHLEIWPIAGKPDIIAGGGVTFIENGGGQIVDNGGPWTVSGAPVFTSAFIQMSGGGTAVLDVSTAFNGALGAASNGANISDNAILTNHTGTALPTLLGGAVRTWNGGRVSPDDGGTISGLTGGVASAALSSPANSGILSLTTGSGTMFATGQFSLSFLDEKINPLSNHMSPCAINMVDAGWPGTSTIFSGVPGATSTTFQWQTNGAALAPVTTYYLTYVCGD